MKILFIIPWVPYPLHSGGNQAFFNMLNTLRNKHKITLVPYCYSAKDLKVAKELQGVWTDVVIDPYVDNVSTQIRNVKLSRYEKIKYTLCNKLEASMRRKQARIFRKHKLSEVPNIERTQYASDIFNLGQFVKENSTLFRSALELNPQYLKYIYNKSREGFDIIQVEFFECLPLVYVLPEDVRKVFVHHEIRFVRNENEANLFDSYTMYDDIRQQKLKDEELSLLNRYNDIIVLTETDKNILKSYLPEKNIYVSPALTSAASATDEKEFKPCKDLVFIGGSDHFPNADGAIWFASQVSTLLRKQNFDGNIYIVGKWSEEAKTVIHKFDQDIQFTGFIDDLYGFINGKITIVPIRIGSGMRMKILDAVAAKSPIITTSKGSEGLPFVDGKDCLTCNDAQSFAQGILHLLKDVQLQETLATNAATKKAGLMDAKQLLQTRMDFYK